MPVSLQTFIVYNIKHKYIEEILKYIFKTVNTPVQKKWLKILKQLLNKTDDN